MTVNILDFEVVLNQLWGIGVTPSDEHREALRKLVELTIEWRGDGDLEVLDPEWLHTAEVQTTQGVRSPLQVLADPVLTDETARQIEAALAA